MTITPKQREERKKAIGSSDMPAVLDCDPWRTSADVWLEKTQDVAEVEENEAMSLGNDLEAGLVEWAGKQLGVEVRPNMGRLVEVNNMYATLPQIISGEVPPPIPFIANLDALVVAKPQAIEAKTGSGEGYGEPGTNQVPDRVTIQTHHQMLVWNLELVWVPVLIAKRDRLVREMYRVERHEPLIDLIRERGADFWMNHVLAKVCPTPGPPSLEVLKRVKRTPNLVAEIPKELVERYERAQMAKKGAEITEADAKAELLTAMGSAEAGDYGDPNYLFTYYSQSREAYTVKATEFRVLRKTKRR